MGALKPRLKWWGLIVIILCLIFTGVAAASIAAKPGQLFQLPGKQACVAEGDSQGACITVPALAGLSAVIVSPDNRNVYTASYFGQSVDTFLRDHYTGALQFKKCFSSSYADCAPAPALNGAIALAFSPDGQYLYVVSSSDGAINVFARNGDGSLAFVACYSYDGSDGACTEVTGMEDANSVSVTKDGKNVYVTTASSVVIFRRLTNGKLAQLPLPQGCLMSPPAEQDEGAPPPPDCSVVNNGLDAPASVLITADGRHAYVAGGRAVAAFARAPDGSLAQIAGTAGCITDDGSDGACASMPSLGDLVEAAMDPAGHMFYAADFFSDAVLMFRFGSGGGLVAPSGPAAGLDGPTSVALSPDGQTLYATSTPSNTVLAYNRATDGSLTQLQCVNADGSNGCKAGVSMAAPQALAISPDGSNVYVGASLGLPIPYYNSIDIFARELPSFSLRLSISGSGMVTFRPAGISCSRTCSASFKFGTQVTMKATAAKGWKFSSWRGGCSGTQVCTVKIGSVNPQISATFVKAKVKTRKK